MANLSHQPDRNVNRLVQDIERSVRELERFSMKWREHGPFKVVFGGTIANGSYTSTDARIPGARQGKAVLVVAAQIALAAGTFLTGTVAQTDIVRISQFNMSGAGVDVSGPQYFRILVEQ